jgi:hypothetical protein
MTGLPAHVEGEIAGHLDQIKRLFKNPKLTLLVRNDIGPGMDADVVMTDDDLTSAIDALVRRRALGPA